MKYLLVVTVANPDISDLPPMTWTRGFHELTKAVEHIKKLRLDGFNVIRAHINGAEFTDD